MENTIALVKPKLTAAEKKIIAMVIDGLPSENSRRAYGRHLEEFFLRHAFDRPNAISNLRVEQIIIFGFGGEFSDCREFLIDGS